MVCGGRYKNFKYPDYRVQYRSGQPCKSTPSGILAMMRQIANSDPVFAAKYRLMLAEPHDLQSIMKRNDKIHPKTVCCNREPG